MKVIGIALLLLSSSFARPQQAYIPDTCPIPQQETCPAYSSDPQGAQNCYARNSNLNARYYQCEQELQRARQKAYEAYQQQLRDEEHRRYCQQHPNASGCG